MPLDRKIIVIGALLLTVIIFALFFKLSYAPDNNGEDEMKADFKSIPMEKAREIFAEKGDYIILDVRRADEYAEGHIPGAINVANEDISDYMPDELPDLDATIYVYCRSGRRSKEASRKLADIGYTDINEFGGIIDWTGEIER